MVRISGLGFTVYGLGIRKKIGCLIFEHKIMAFRGIFRL